MKLQVSHGVCTKVQTEVVFLEKTLGHQANIQAVMPMERGQNDRRSSMTMTHAGECPVQNERFRMYGAEREKARC